MQQEPFIVQLEAELQNSLKRLEAAKKDRERAALEEVKWEQDVKALRNLLSRRRDEPSNAVIIASLRASAENDSNGDDPSFVSGYEEVNRVEWIFDRVAESGSVGVLPTEIFESSQKVGLTMHSNYPYVALGKLLERGRVEKVGKRYRAIEKEVSPEEKTS